MTETEQSTKLRGAVLPKRALDLGYNEMCL